MFDFERSVYGGTATCTHPEAVDQAPIFLVGCVRSGTTLLRLMLDHHPEIAFDSEFEYSVEQIGSRGDLPDLGRYHQYLATNRIFLDAKRVIDPDLDYRGLVQSFLQQKRDQADKPLIGATVHHGFEHLLKIWPDARFIHLVRDGRDVSLSIEAYGWSGSSYTAADWWVKAERDWDNLRRQLPKERYIEVRFEDLILESEDTLNHICWFLGIDYSEEMLSYPSGTTYALPSSSRCYAWRFADPASIALMEARLGRMLIRCGYDWSGLPVPAITLNEHQQLKRAARIKQIRRRLTERGPLLFAAELLGRRAGLAPLKRWAAPRIHAIERTQIR